MRRHVYVRAWTREAARAASLAAAGAGLGLLAGAVHPRALPLGATWADLSARAAAAEGLGRATLAETAAALASGRYVILDARPPAEFRAGHLPGAISLALPEADARFPLVQMLLVPGQPILVYDGGPWEDEALRLGRFLLEQGYGPVKLLAEGTAGWREAGHRLETGGGAL